MNSRMNARSGRFAGTALLVLVATACGSGLAREPSSPPEPRASADPPPRPVRVVHPELVRFDESYRSSLYLERDVQVTARADGIIEQVLVDRGQKVRAGAPLALLETDLASREVEMAEQSLRLAQADYDRVRSLNDQQMISPQEFQRAEIARDRASSLLGLARARLERCTLRAPFDGVIAERWAIAGERVREDDGAPLFRVVASDPLRARVDLPERRLAHLAASSRAVLTVEGDPSTYPARVVFRGPVIDPASGTGPVIVEAVGGGHGLQPGAAVTVRFEGLPANEPAALRLPREALPPGRPADGGEALLMIVSQGRAVSRRVQVISSQDGSVMVTGGLSSSDEVILSAGAGVAEGDAVSPREAVQ